MNIIEKVFSSTAGAFIEKVGGVIDMFVTTDDERNKAKLEMSKLVMAREAQVQATLQAEIQAKERILVAEMQQGDNYTKRARPTIVYAGLVMIFVNYVVAPFTNSQPFPLPAEFWAAWGGVAGLWIIGRSGERMAGISKATKALTGNEKTPSILE